MALRRVLSLQTDQNGIRTNQVLDLLRCVLEAEDIYLQVISTGSAGASFSLPWNHRTDPS